MELADVVEAVVAVVVDVLLGVLVLLPTSTFFSSDRRTGALIQLLVGLCLATAVAAVVGGPVAVG